MTHSHQLKPQAQAETQRLRPFGFLSTLLLFGIPTAALFGVYYMLMPTFIRFGLRPFYAYAFAFIFLFAGMIGAAFVGYYLERQPRSWHHFKARFRLRCMNRRDWAWTLGGFVGALVLFFLVQPLSAWLVDGGFVPLPQSLPAFLNPVVGGTAVLYDEAVGGVQGNWAFLLTAILLLVMNVVGEEIWWRGYVLPRQEPAFGRTTWLIHGLLWTLFHAALWWNLLNLLPLTLGLVFVAARRHSTTVGLVTHTLHKADFFLVTIPLFLFGVR